MPKRIRAVLLGRKSSGAVELLDSGDRDEIYKKARAMKETGIPGGFDSVESWDEEKGRIYLEDGSRCRKPAEPAKKKAAKSK